MLPVPLYTFLLAAASAVGVVALPRGGARTAAREPRGDDGSTGTDGANSQKLLIGGGPSGTISAADYDGSTFTITANNTIAGTSASWLLFKEPNLLYAVDENSNATRLFNYDSGTNTFNLVQSVNGSAGVVHLELTKDKKTMVGAAYGGGGAIDVWDISAADGQMKLIKQIAAGGTLGPNPDRQEAAHPHEILLDNSGRFFVVPDLGTDSLIVIDSTNFDIVNRVSVTPAGAGPRHGSFYPQGLGDKATHFFVVCELGNIIKVYQLDYSNSTLEFTEVQTISTFGAAFPPANATSAAAGELVIDSDNKNLYISNRLTGNETDNISHFSIDMDNAKAPLKFVDQVSSGGTLPRMFSLSKNEDVLFSTNQDGEIGLLAFAKDKKTGSLSEKPLATVALAQFGAAGYGPQYVAEIGAEGSAI